MEGSPASSRKRSSDHGDSSKRQKVSRACDACKQRKAKCSGTLPCNNCSAKGIQCLYMTKYGRGRPPTPPPATPPSHLQPPQLQPQAHRQSQPTPFPPSRASPDLGLTEIQGQYVDRTSGLAFLDRAWKRLSQQPRIAQGLPGNEAGVDDHPADNARWSDRHQDQLQMCAGDKSFDIDHSGTLPIPDRAAASELVGFYFDVCIATYRFLHRPSVESWLGQLQHNVDHTMPLSHELGDMRAAIILTILAIAIFHRGKSRGGLSSDEEILAIRRSDRLFMAATRLTDSATGYPTLESVQARLIQVLYLLHSSRMNQTWYVFGTVVQTIAALGLHRKTNRARARPVATKETPRDYIASQCRKRTFWVAYILDIYLGVIFGRPRHYHDQDIDQELPDAVNDEDMAPEGPKPHKNKDCSINSLIFHAKIARVVGQVSQQVYSLDQPSREVLDDIVRSIKADLNVWRSSLPPILGSVNPASLIPPFRRQATALKLAYYHALMHATRPFLLQQSGRTQDGSPLTHISDCLLAARDVLEMVDDMARDGTLFHAFWWTHYVTFCALAVVYVWEIQRSLLPLDSIHELDVQLEGLFDLAERCQHHLAEATASNSPSRRYSIILEEMRQEAKCHSPGGTRRFVLDRPHLEALAMNDGNMDVGADMGQSAFDQAAMALDTNLAGMQNFWNGWQTTDWLDIDALAFGPFSGFDASPGPWLPEASAEFM